MISFRVLLSSWLFVLFTDDVDESEQLAEEVAIRPEVVVLQVRIEVVQQELLLLSLFNLKRDDGK